MDVVIKAVLIMVGVAAAAIVLYFLWFVLIVILMLLVMYLPVILSLVIGITVGIKVGGSGGVIIVIFTLIVTCFVHESWVDSSLCERINDFFSSLLPGK